LRLFDFLRAVKNTRAPNSRRPNPMTLKTMGSGRLKYATRVALSKINTNPVAKEKMQFPIKYGFAEFILCSY
jgi:hypothetical protein